MLALGICGAVMQSCDDDDDNLNVPEELRSAFSQKYPGSVPEWKTRSNYYIADFRDQSYEAVKNALQNSEYATWNRDDADMLERKGLEPVYVLEVEQGSREMDLYYNAEGILIKAMEDYEDDSESYLPIELPEGVKNFLQEKYAESKIVETDREHGRLEVDIIHHGVVKEVVFDDSGNWLSTSREIGWNSLPEVVKIAIQREISNNYVGYEADDEPEQVETPDGNYYRIELEAEQAKDLILKIREDGTLLQ